MSVNVSRSIQQVAQKLKQDIMGCDSKGVLMDEPKLSLGELVERPGWFKRPCLV